MTDMDLPLPSYENPPVIEVALSVQFEPIKSLRTAHLGLFWAGLRDRFPRIEEHPPLDPVIEKFGSLPRQGRRPVQFQVLDSLPAPRCWLLSQTGTELIQIQADRFIHNWRKTAGHEPYPRYGHLRQTFAGELEAFREFLQREGLGTLHANQCEVTYVNHIVSGEGWNNFGELAKVLTVFSPSYSEGFLAEPEDVRLKLRYTICDKQGEPIGRLHVVVEPAYRTTDGRALLVMNLTARGRPRGAEMDDVLEFLDVGREWIVRGFTTITTPEMHQVWRRQDGQ